MNSLQSLLFMSCVVTIVITNVTSLEDHVENVVRRRKLREAGYDTFEVTNVHEITSRDTLESLNIKDLKRRKRSADDEIVKLTLSAHGQIFQLHVKHVPSVIHPDARIIIHKKEGQVVWKDEKPDCFMTGEVTSHGRGTASFSICDGLNGYFSDGHNTYIVETISPGNTQGTTVLVGMKSFNVTCEHKDNTAAVDAHDGVRNALPRLLRRKRATSYTTITLEIGLYVDALYVEYLESIGATTEADRHKILALKWSGVQAEFSKADELGYDVVLKIKSVTYYETNPTWYTTSVQASSIVGVFCQNILEEANLPDFDHIHLHSGISGTTSGGYSVFAGVCGSSRCAVALEKDPATSYLSTHELGHNLDMKHDEDVGCSDTNTYAIMEGNGKKTSGWSTCSKDALAGFITSSKAACVFTTDVTTADAFAIEKLFPGMILTDNEMCEMYHTTGWQFRLFPYTESAWHNCTAYSCVNLNVDSATYGTMTTYDGAIKGRYCGQDMYCLEGSCSTWEATGLDPTLKEVVEGGWGSFGPQSECTRTCGTGMQVRQRFCDTPKPKNSFGCAGPEFEATTCNTQPCTGDSSSTGALIRQRAAEVCSSLIQSNILDGSVYSGTGVLFWGGGYDFGMCEVKCDRIDGGNTGNQRFGLMPDGTPCSPSALNNKVENVGMSRRSGKEARCIRGQCVTLGCDGNVGDVAYDGCGVCGGAGDSCQVVEGIYNTTLAKNERQTMFELPTGTHHIQLYFTFSKMAYNFLEIRTKDGVQVLATLGSSGTARVQDASENPVTFAGTYWYYKFDQQFVYADGPLDQPAIIGLYNYQGKDNKGINYAYSLPLHSELASCSGVCDQGTFNITTCGCDCDSGYYGKTCNTTCSKFCPNNAGHTSSCKCDCPDPYTTGSKCVCAGSWTGVNCLVCGLTCENGGTLNSTSCACTCPTPYTTGSTCVCVGSRTGENCLVCGLTCENGGTLDSTNCACTCPAGYTGDSCNVGPTTASTSTTTTTTAASTLVQSTVSVTGGVPGSGLDSGAGWTSLRQMVAVLSFTFVFMELCV